MARRRRYVLKLSGTVRSTDGRDLLLSEEIPFYAISDSALPYIVSFSPGDGTSTRNFDIDNIVLSFTFSEPMERRSTEAAFTCDGLGDKKFEWINDDKVLMIINKNVLNPWTVYRWTISEKALSREGVPLAKEASGRFITDEDHIFPKLTNIFPLVRSEVTSSWGFWVPVDINMKNGLGAGAAIGMEFNKPIDSDSLKRSFSFEPSLPGRVEQPRSNRAVFIPDRNTEPETAYTMKISKDLKDDDGLKMGEDYTLLFWSDIPFLGIDYFAPDRLGEQLNPKNGEVFKIPLDEGDGGILRFMIRFSLPFSDEAMMDMAFGISFETFFPGTLRPVMLKSARWYSRYLLRMEWEGIETGKPNELHFYQLKIPGGRNGISNGSGSYLKEDLSFIIEAVDL